MKTEEIRARVPETLKREFEAVAEADGWTISHAIRQLMNEYVSKAKNLRRRNAETLKALEELEAGHVVDGDQVMDWLSSWGTENEQEPPK